MGASKSDDSPPGQHDIKIKNSDEKKIHFDCMIKFHQSAC